MVMRIILTLVVLFSFSLSFSDFSYKSSYYLTKEDLSLEEIKNVKGFIPSKGEFFGVTDQYCWLRLEMKNSSSKDLIRVFEFKYPYMDDIRVYKNNTVEKYGKTNNYNKSIKSIENNVFKIDLQAFEHKTIYIRIKSSFNIKTFLDDFTQEEYRDSIFLRKSLFYFCYGILLSFVIYNFFIWFSVKKDYFLYYVIFHFTYFLGIISWSGFGFEFIWPEFPIFNYYSYGIIANLVYGFQILFFFSFLDTKTYLPKSTKTLKIFAYLFFLFSVSSIFYQTTFLYEFVSIISTFLLLWVILYLIFVKKVKLAIYILIAELIIFGAHIIIVLLDIGVIKDSFFLYYIFVWGTSVEVVLISFAIGYKYKLLELESLKEREKRIETQDMLLSKQKLAIMGEMMNNLVHQWRQPLGQINSAVCSLEQDYSMKRLDSKKLEERLNDIESITLYLSNIINDFRDFSTSKDKGNYTLKEIIDNALAIINFVYQNNGIEIEVIHKDLNTQIYLEKNQLIQVLIIILTNAKDILVEDKVKEPKVLIETYLDKNKNIIKISNNGSSIPQEIQDKIFDPYFTTKGPETGTGLGLYIARLILGEKLNGQIKLSSNQNWTSFIISL